MKSIFFVLTFFLFNSQILYSQKLEQRDSAIYYAEQAGNLKFSLVEAGWVYEETKKVFIKVTLLDEEVRVDDDYNSVYSLHRKEKEEITKDNIFFEWQAVDEKGNSCFVLFKKKKGAKYIRLEIQYTNIKGSSPHGVYYLIRDKSY